MIQCIIVQLNARQLAELSGAPHFLKCYNKILYKRKRAKNRQINNDFAPLNFLNP